MIDDDTIRVRHTNPDIEIPAGSFAIFDGWDWLRQCFKVVQPNKNNLPFCQIIIIPITIPAGTIARIGLAYTDDLHIVLKAAEDSIIIDDTVGTTEDSWLAKKFGNRGMFVVKAISGNELIIRPKIGDFVRCYIINL